MEESLEVLSHLLVIIFDINITKMILTKLRTLTRRYNQKGAKKKGKKERKKKNGQQQFDRSYFHTIIDLSREAHMGRPPNSINHMAFALVGVYD